MTRITTFLFPLLVQTHGFSVQSSLRSVVSTSASASVAARSSGAFPDQICQTTTATERPITAISMIGTGFSFDDGEQVLVSVQKPLGILLEQEADDGPVIVGEVDPSGSAGRAGIQQGDILVAVQNASVEQQTIEYVMEFLAKAPQVVNLRFVRPAQ